MYSLDAVNLRKQEKASVDFTLEQKQDVADILTAMFGTPDDPHLPVVDGIDELVDIDNLRMAAGPVGRDEGQRAHGLYREHCVHCHGISGDGRGPTAAFLNPYPRDYRMGVFKFKSTPKGGRPTHDDLYRLLINGVAGTAMPSFKLLPESEVESLVDYVKYLSLRGEVERRLYEELAIELDEGERLLDDSDLAAANELIVEDILATIVGKWKQAESQAANVPQRPNWVGDEKLVSIERGKQLFYGAVANCVKCHGESQLGDGEMTDYDDWTKDFHDWTKPISPEKKAELEAELMSLGGLEPRNIIPRNLRSGIYRGGRRPVDLYWRILNGIDGSPMPAAMQKPEGAGPEVKGLTSDDIWHIVDYVQSLPYENVMVTGEDEPVYARLRQ
jgi:mono/diheme cytochrome c family protein